MNISIPMVEILIVITAYSLGVWTGSRFFCTGNPHGAVPQDRQGARRTYSDEYSGKVLTDPEKRKRYEEDLKAFQDCMKYSQETAYGVKE